MDLYKQILELKGMLEMDSLPDDTKEEIKTAIKLAESTIANEGKPNPSKIEVKFLNKSNNKNPVYANEGDSGFDLRADLKEPTTLKPMDRGLINTGLFFDLPQGYDMEIRSRSGMALKHGVIVLNTPGTIDLNYVGEIGVILINLSGEDFTINPGDRIAQGLIRLSTTNANINLFEVDSISKETERGDKGFGSSGVK